jgi:hypothetical protein
MKEFFMKSSNGKTAYYSDERFIYAQTTDEDGKIVEYKLALFDNGFYKLRLWNGIPILEIDGLRMHLVKEFKTPLDYSKQVVKRLDLHSGNCVLDTCMGLGYTAIESLSYGAIVTTCEISRAVHTLAKWNPFSEKLFTSERIKVVEGSIAEKIKNMPDSSFDTIIHDPPRFSVAGELYSLEFYRQMHRVLKKGGRLFHYVGSVGKGRGRKIEEEVEKRLTEAGFKLIRYNKLVQGLFSKK